MKLPRGFKAAAVKAGIKKEKLDLGLIYSKDPLLATGVFTKNSNVAYSVTLSKENIKNPINAVLVNSGNANCFSHSAGLKDSKQIIASLANQLNVMPANILFSSTGIIAKVLPKDKVISSFPVLIDSLGDDIENFAQSILTTDTFAKISFKEIDLKAGRVKIIGVAKGSGMIQPDMATMLGFILTDAKLTPGLFKKINKNAIDKTFNSITVDGCMSTNDCVFGLSSGKVALTSQKEIDCFTRIYNEICLDLAKMIVKDGEGATKFIEIKIVGAKNEKQAKLGAFAIANSNLVKCALYGNNANWGRIVSALGQVGIEVPASFKIKSTDIKNKEVVISLDLKQGKSSWSVYTCDLTPEYIKINAEYN